MPELRPFTESEMRELLREASSQDPEKSLLGHITRCFQDSAVRVNGNDRARVHRLWLRLGLVLLSVICVFLYFSFIRQ